uniref:Uncharacterized protein n=1 Tax=Chlorocebus sabaeus TaxID=60711 RepID=A0A0D9RXP5_CHLSB
MSHLPAVSRVFFQFPAPHPPTVLRPQLGLDPNPKCGRGKMSVRDHDPEVPMRNSEACKPRGQLSGHLLKPRVPLEAA